MTTPMKGANAPQPGLSLSRDIMRALSAIAKVSCILIGLSCGGDRLATQPTESDALYASLTLDHHAITLSTTQPYDTLQLSAVARSPSGAAIAGAGMPTFVSGDAVRLSVDAHGLLKALASGTGIQVIATLQIDNVTHTDTSYVDIVDDPSPSSLAGLSIHPVAPDSAKTAALWNIPKQLFVRAVNVAHDSITGLRADFVSSDPTIAVVDRAAGVVTGVRPGHVRIIATATVFGATVVDTLPFTVGLPIGYDVKVAPSTVPNSTLPVGFTPSEIHVGVGASITWTFAEDMIPVDVTFDDSTRVAEDTVDFFAMHTGAGNIAPPVDCRADVPLAFVLNCIKGRSFPEPGTFTYHSTLTGAAGEVIVEDESTSSTP